MIIQIASNSFKSFCNCWKILFQWDSGYCIQVGQGFVSTGMWCYFLWSMEIKYRNLPNWIRKGRSLIEYWSSREGDSRDARNYWLNFVNDVSILVECKLNTEHGWSTISELPRRFAFISLLLLFTSAMYHFFNSMDNFTVFSLQLWTYAMLNMFSLRKAMPSHLSLSSPYALNLIFNGGSKCFSSFSASHTIINCVCKLANEKRHLGVRAVSHFFT